MKLAETLKRLLYQHNLSESKLARLTGINQPVVHRLASGETDNPKISTILPIANHFEVSIEQLLGQEPIPMGQQPRITVPLLTDEQATQLDKRPDQCPLIVIDFHAPKTVFAVTLNDSSMKPLFPLGSILVIDPEQTPKDSDYVLVNLPDQKKVIFKQLLSDGHHYLLKSLNPDFPTVPLAHTDHVIGIMIQARIDFRNQ